jgi:cellulose synthase/poly-beta-1,6-N-acetylglucosamine synthase-like glycosyltransferase
MIPIRNEATYSGRCMDATISQDYPREKYETLVAGGLSDEGTHHQFKAYSANDAREKPFNNPCKIVVSEHNWLICQAQGESLVNIDGNCVIAPDDISRCLGHLQTKILDGIGVPIQ